MPRDSAVVSARAAGSQVRGADAEAVALIATLSVALRLGALCGGALPLERPLHVAAEGAEVHRAAGHGARHHRHEHRSRLDALRQLASLGRELERIGVARVGKPRLPSAGGSTSAEGRGGKPTWDAAPVGASCGGLSASRWGRSLRPSRRRPRGARPPGSHSQRAAQRTTKATDGESGLTAREASTSALFLAGAARGYAARICATSPPACSSGSPSPRSSRAAPSRRRAVRPPGRAREAARPAAREARARPPPRARRAARARPPPLLKHERRWRRRGRGRSGRRERNRRAGRHAADARGRRLLRHDPRGLRQHEPVPVHRRV